ncbi:MAG: ABC transporter permease [Nitrososphaerota archaeon]|jgi:lipooligosaccharide transport system permease protein|nr:ABC transporter permease [Nitrososphaerota archaeon]
MSKTHIRASPAKLSIPHLSYRVWIVWRRNVDVFFKTIKVNFFPSLLEPILYLFAFGFGLGGFIPDIAGQPYINFIAPALVAVAIMNGSFFECTFASFVRMYFQKTFDAIVATPVSVEEVVAGEMLWGATRATINATIVLVVVAVAGLFTPVPLVSSPLFLLAVPIAFLGGLLFSAIAMCFTAAAPNIDFFNYPSFLFLTPMFFLCGTFFPLTSLPIVAQSLAMAILPLTHIVNVIRAVLVGGVEPIWGLSTGALLSVSLVWLTVVTVAFFILSINLMKKRLTS